MRPYDKNNWKKKIDPAFDKPVKTYIKFVREIERLPNDGQVTFKDESIELNIRNNNLLPDYENKFETEMLQFNKDVGLVTEQECDVLLDILPAIEEYNIFLIKLQKTGSRRTITRYFKLLYLRFVIQPNITPHLHSLMKFAENLPEEESKQYYARKINTFIKDMRKKHFFKFQKDFVLIFCSIFVRFTFNRIDQSNEENATKEEIEHFNKSIVISKVTGFINSTMSLISHQKDMPELLNNIEKGDDGSLFDAITTDKTLASSGSVKKRVDLALDSGDNKFLNKMGDKIAKQPLEKIALHGKTCAVLKFFWSNSIELHKLNNQELYDFLKSCGLHPPNYPEGFTKFMQRHIKLNKKN